MRTLRDLLLVACLLCLGYAQSNAIVQTCQNFVYSNSLRQVFVLHDSDSIIVQVLFPLSLLSSIGIILVYWRFPPVRQQPGDILLALSVSGLFLLVSYFSTAIYNTHHPLSGPVPDDFDDFCLATGYFYSLSFCATVIYNIVFCINFVLQLKNPLRGKCVFSVDNKRRATIHIICFTILCATGLVFYLTDCIGISLNGVCGFKVSPVSIFIQCGVIFIYLAVLISSLFYFKRYIPKAATDQVNWKQFITYYYRYIIAVSIDTLIRSVSDLIASINCALNDPQPNLFAFITVSNTFNLIMPVIIFVVILFHPHMKRYIHRILIKIFGERYKPGDEMQMSLLGSIKQHSRSTLVYSLLTAIYMEDEQINAYNSLKQINDWNFEDKIVMKINKHVEMDYEKVSIPSMNVIDVQVTSYAPKVFKTLMKIDGLGTLQQHVVPKLNEARIKKMAENSGDGGKSGEFFFFTYDNKLILKTLNPKELDVIMSRLKDYVEHCTTNPNTLITKIAGIYRIKQVESDREETIIYVMRNLAGCSSEFIERKYDLKGSKFDRQVIKINYDCIREDERIDQTMKDQDFDKIEKKILGDEEELQQIRSILTADSEFFKRQKLIDYSLMVIKLDIESLLKSKGMNRDGYMKTLANPYSIVFSSQRNCAYAIGIIDYLQTWTANKKSERFFKSLFFKTKTDEISAQDPDLYSDRFIKELVFKIF